MMIRKTAPINCEHFCKVCTLGLLLVLGPLLLCCERFDSRFEVDVEKDIDLVATSARRWTGVAKTMEQLFVCYPNYSDDHSVSVADMTDTADAKPFPDHAWNTWSRDADPKRHFISVHAIVVDANNDLWVLDSATPKRGGVAQTRVAGGAKLLCFDPDSRQPTAEIYFDDALLKPNSYLSDLRVDARRQVAYVADSGAGGIIVVDLAAGQARRILDGDVSTASEHKILNVEGKRLDHLFPEIAVNELALSSQHLYWRALAGSTLYRLPLHVLDETPPQDLAHHVENLGEFAASDAMTFGFHGELYLGCVEENAIRAYGGGNYARLVKQREDLKWPSAFGLGHDGYLYVACAQLHNAVPDGRFKIFKIKVKFD